MKMLLLIVQISKCKQCIRVPTEIQKHNSMIFHDQQYNFHDYLMHGLQTAHFSSIFTMRSNNAEFSNNSMLLNHACILKLLKLGTTSSQKTSCWTHKCPTASFLAIGGFVKLFHKIPWFFHDYPGFSKFQDFSMHGTFLVIFQVFHDF